MQCNPKGRAEARTYNDNNQVTPMSIKEINAIKAIVAQCEILHSSGQNLLALKIMLCIAPELRNLTTEPKECDD